MEDEHAGDVEDEDVDDNVNEGGEDEEDLWGCPCGSVAALNPGAWDRASARDLATAFSSVAAMFTMVLT